MRSQIDLHIHTTASDGSDSPAELARKLTGADIRMFSVTDHDTIDGALQMETLVPPGMVYIRGVEFSCVSQSGKCHILGYGYDPEHPALLAALEEGRMLRLEKLQRRLDALREYFGIVLTGEELAWLHSRNSPGKPHLGKILLDRGLADSLDGAIRTYLKMKVPGRDRIDAEIAIAAIEKAGGLSAWAHPLGGEGENRLTAENFDRQLRTLLDAGLRGMECHYSRYDPEEVRFLLERAARHGLTVTGGSDYHGVNKRGLELGMLSTAQTPWIPAGNQLRSLMELA